MKSALITELPAVPADLQNLEQWITDREQQISDLKDATRAHIVWNCDQPYHKTSYSLVYLHGFSASHGEGDPVHKRLAKRFGMNIYLARLKEHGRTKYEFKHLSMQGLLSSAAEALAIGRKIGDNTILMGTSTGASLALYLASEFTSVNGLILFSPLIRFYRWRVKMLTNPLIRKVMEKILGREYLVHNDEQDGLIEQIWYSKYRLQGILALAELVDKTMTADVFSRINQPVFMGYYYKNKKEQDPTVSTSAMLSMFDQLNTPPEKKRKKAFPQAGAHVIGSNLKSGAWEEVLEESSLFCEHYLGLQPHSATI